MERARTFTAFAGQRLIERGCIETTLVAVKRRLDAGETESILVFEDQTGNPIDFDWRGTEQDVLGRLGEHPAFGTPPADGGARSGPGRPKLGVVSREISLLPRHWQWLESQPGGISAALRRLVDEARKAQPEKEEATRVRDATSRFMWVMAGNLPNFEEASRALFSNDKERFRCLIEDWPADIREHLHQLVQTVFAASK